MIYYIFFTILLTFALFCVWQISKTDIQRRIIPDVYLFPLLLTGLIILTFFSWPVSIKEGSIAATFGYILAILIGVLFNIVKKDKKHKYETPIGMGDIKLISVGGLWLGVTGLSLALIFACVSGLIWGTTKRQRVIPFAPFFLSGGIFALIIISFLI